MSHWKLISFRQSAVVICILGRMLVLLHLLVTGGEEEGRRGAKATDTLKTAMCFQSQFLGSLHSLLPNAPENNPTVFFPWFSGNDLTARKRNAKHSLELCVTSARRRGPCSSASLDIPEHT